MNFVLGLIFCLLLFVCLFLELCLAVRPIFSVVFLIGVISLAVALFFAGILLAPLFIAGVCISIPVFLIALLLGGSKDDKR